MVDCSLSDGQKAELRKIYYEIEAAYGDGSLNADERQKLLLSMTDCGMELPLAPTEAGINGSELQDRLKKYMGSDLFQMDMDALAKEYQAQGLPVPPEEQLREEAGTEARKCLETMMACEAKGHLWKGKDAGRENGTSTPPCRRCGAEEHLQ